MYSYPPPPPQQTSGLRIFWIAWCSTWALAWLLVGFLTFGLAWVLIPFSLLAILLPVGENKPPQLPPPPPYGYYPPQAPPPPPYGYSQLPPGQ